VETESSVIKLVEEKPLNTPDVSAQDAEAMANAMLLDSPLPNSERGNEVLEDGGSDKLPEEGEGVKLPGKVQPEETPASKPVSPCRKGIFSLLLI